jgi:hypothetical protein
MFPLSHSFLKLAVAGALIALTAATTRAGADEMVQNLGPVPAHQPILQTVGNKHVIAFSMPPRQKVHIGPTLVIASTTMARFHIA